MCQKDYSIYSRKGKHLNYDERVSIERWFNIDKRTRIEIAELLNRCEKTIRNEIKRGLVYIKTPLWEDKLVYSADIAQQKYEYFLESKGPQLKIGNDYELQEYIEKSIKKLRKSPEVIAYEIKNKDFKVKICAKTIRNCIKKKIFNIKQKDMIYKKEFKEKNPERRKSSRIPPEKSIEFRPQEVKDRKVYGHWEGDLVVGPKNQGSCLFTLTERKTREEIITKISGKASEFVVKALDSIERKYGKEFSKKFKTITFDNGVEFSDYEGMEKSVKNKEKRTTVYFAHPYCSSERGTNENANRLIRRFIPKGTDITPITDDFIQEIENWINDYPRKMFGYLSTNNLLETCLS